MKPRFSQVDKMPIFSVAVLNLAVDFCRLSLSVRLFALKMIEIPQIINAYKLLTRTFVKAPISVFLAFDFALMIRLIAL